MRELVDTTLCLGALRVSCRGPASDVAWLEEFLGPWFARSSGGDPTVEVALRPADAEAMGWLEAGAPAGALALDAFAMDRGVQTLPGVRDTRGGVTALDAGLRVVHRISADRRCIEVLCGAHARKARIAWMQVVRELGMSALRAEGVALVHGALFDLGGRGVLVAGPKRAGKTTLLVHGLRAGARFGSNDRVAIGRPADPPRARGVPTVVSIRPATLELLPGLAERLADGRIDHLYTLAEIESGRSPERPRPGRPRNLSAAQLCRQLDAEAAAELPLHVLVLLRTGERPGVALRELAPEAAGPRLAASLLGSAGRISALFRPPGVLEAAPVALARRRCAEVAWGVRCVDLELGIGTRAGEIRAAVEALAEPAAGGG